MAQDYSQAVGDEWVSFPGGELEGKRPKALCPPCRESLKQEASGRFSPSRPSSPTRPLCFQCYRADLDRERSIRAAGQLDTASDERFQSQLPFETVDKPRLMMLKAERAGARAPTNAPRVPGPRPPTPHAHDQSPTPPDARATTNAQRPTPNDQRPTTNDQRPTTNDQRPMTNDQ